MSLKITLGCMYSGKSTELLRLYRRYNLIYDSQNILVITHQIDNRYGEQVISTHDKNQIPSHSLTNLMNIYETEIFFQSQVIFIEEAQFFPDLKEFVLLAVERLNKKVYVFGLDGDFQRKPFGQILDLIPYCDKVVKLKAICSICQDGTEGIFTKRIVDSQEQTLVGNQDSYIAVCRKHFLEEN